MPPVAAAGQGDDIVVRGEIAGVPDAAAADTLLVLAEDAGGTGFSRSERTPPGFR